MIAKILIALGALAAFAALVVALAQIPDTHPAPAPNTPPGLCKDKPHHKLNPDQQERCDR